MESSRSTVPIETKQLEQFTDRANRLLRVVKWTPKSGAFADADKETSKIAWRDSSSAQAQTEELSLIKIARVLCGDPLLFSEDINHALSVIRQGLRIGMHLSNTYTKFSGLDNLVALNGRGGLAEAQKVEFRAKYYTASAITVFSAASYVVWELSTYKNEELGNIQMDFPGLPELSLRDPVRALECLVYYHGAFVEKSGLVHGDAEFLKLTILYFRAVVEEIKRRESSFQYAESFYSNTYKLENSEFCVDGFSADLDGSQHSVEFNRVELEQVVGNRDAKHQARRLAARLFCYDLNTGRNPMYELGGLVPITLGYGEPGTGKSMLISATATLLQDYSKNLGIPFLFWPMPDTVVSTFQGGSAERMMNWMQALKDPGKIIYAPIDDAENNLEERTRQGVSAGVREVIAVFLRNTEGAYAVHRGNTLIQLFTNLAEQIDKAVLSRINDRVYIGGASSFEDFVDQDYLWFAKHKEIDPSFVNMKDPDDYRYLEKQTLLENLGEVYESFSEPKEEQVRDIFAKVQQEFKTDEHAFFGEFFARIKTAFPYFTSRDLRNIQRAVDGRIMDFDLPEEWFENPEIFSKKEYETKKAMIVELMRGNMKGLSFAELRLQETLRYMDTMVNIAETGKERRIEELVEDIGLREEAIRRKALKSV